MTITPHTVSQPCRLVVTPSRGARLQASWRATGAENPRDLVDHSQCEIQSTEEHEDYDGSNESGADGVDHDGTEEELESPPRVPRDPETKDGEAKTEPPRLAPDPATDVPWPTDVEGVRMGGTHTPEGDPRIVTSRPPPPPEDPPPARSKPEDGE